MVGDCSCNFVHLTRNPCLWNNCFWDGDQVCTNCSQLLSSKQLWCIKVAINIQSVCDWTQSRYQLCEICLWWMKCKNLLPSTYNQGKCHHIHLHLDTPLLLWGTDNTENRLATIIIIISNNKKLWKATISFFLIKKRRVVWHCDTLLG